MIRRQFRSSGVLTGLCLALVMLGCISGCDYNPANTARDALANTARFILSGTVTDADGSAMPDVDLVIAITRYDKGTRVDGSTYWFATVEREQQSISGKFDFDREALIRVAMTFSKAGYASETFRFAATEADSNSRVEKTSLKVVLHK